MLLFSIKQGLQYCLNSTLVLDVQVFEGNRLYNECAIMGQQVLT